MLTAGSIKFLPLRNTKVRQAYKISESEHDIFGAGHASTALSAGLGLAHARDIRMKIIPLFQLLETPPYRAA